jgi:spore coat protein U-like protein
MHRAGSATRLAKWLALFFWCSLSFGGTDTAATVTVSTTVSANCKIQSTPGTLALGNYDPVTVNQTTPLDMTGYTITIACVGGSAPRVDIDYGQNAIGSPRRLKSGAANFLNYDIYKPTGPSNNTCFSGSPAVWGTGATNGFTPASNPGSTANQTYSLCARIPAGQDPAVGSYSDQVSAIVNF